MKKKILLVNPEFPENTYWSLNRSLGIVNKKSSMSPLGLITVGGMLPEEDYDVKLIDMNVGELSDEDLQWADAVFVTSMVVQKRSHQEVIRRAKAIDEDKIVVSGGPYATKFYDDPELAGTDHFVLGEAEATLPQFLRDLDKGIASRLYHNVVVRPRGVEREIDTGELEKIVEFFGEDIGNADILSIRPSLDNSPIPRYDLLESDAYISQAMQFTRGCPWSCDFCNEGELYGHQMRLKSPEAVVSELQALYDYGHRWFTFVVDDNMTANRPRIKEVLREVTRFQKDRGYPFNLYTEVDLNIAKDEELLELLNLAGFNRVFMGLESIDEGVFMAMNKKQNLGIDIPAAVKKIHSYGVEVSAGFIVGYDEDPPDICDKLFDFCQESGIVVAMAGLLIAGQGSPLYHRMNQQGRIRNTTDGNNTHDFDLNFVPQRAIDLAEQAGVEKGTDRYEWIVKGVIKDIVDNYKRLIGRLYDASGVNYFARVRRLMETLGRKQLMASGMHAEEIMAGFNSVRRQGFGQTYSREFRKFMGYTLMHNPGMYKLAFEKAITAHHFIGMTQEMLGRR